MLSSVRIVMVATTHPGNIGAAARAMKNMGLSELALVTPKHFPDPEASARASGADDILANATVHPDLVSAIAGCHRVVGASARLRTVAWPQIGPRDCAEAVRNDAPGLRTAIVFGREHAGLTNEELELCHYLMQIPCNPHFSSLNVASAIQIMAYELQVASQLGAPEIPTRVQDTPATADQLNSFHDHLITTLFEAGFLHQRKSSPALIRRIRRIFNRAELDETEINILRGALTAIRRRMAGPSDPA